MPVDETPAMIARGEILGAVTIIGAQHVLLRRPPTWARPSTTAYCPGQVQAGSGLGPARHDEVA
jgi:hypothetical protein